MKNSSNAYSDKSSRLMSGSSNKSVCSKRPPTRSLPTRSGYMNVRLNGNSSLKKQKVSES